MATLDQVYEWLTNNQDKKGTREYEIAVESYRILRTRPPVQIDEEVVTESGMPATSAQFEERFGDIAPQGTPLMSGQEVFDEQVVVEDPDMTSDIAGGVVRGLAPAALGTQDWLLAL
jgi:hypothetical protein